MAYNIDKGIRAFPLAGEAGKGDGALAEDRLSGTVRGTVFRNENNGYSVVSVMADGEETVVVGVLPPLADGERAVFYGGWVEHPDYGRQWKSDGCEIEEPTSLSDIRSYLASGQIKGVGEATADLLVSRFREKTFDAMLDVSQLVKVRGIGPARAKMIALSFAEQYGERRQMMFLQRHGVAPALAARIAKAYGSETEAVMRTNPYRIIDDVDRVGFLTADQIALKMGLPHDSEHRMQYGIKYVLEDAAAASGHTCLPVETLMAQAADVLRTSPQALERHFQALLIRRELLLNEREGRSFAYLSVMYYAEVETAMRLIRLRMTAPTEESASISARIADFERRHGITLSDQQKQAVTGAVTHGVFVITGGPGTGKTTIIKCILNLLGQEQKTLLTAPTGRAAKRMSEATGRHAMTIHRLLVYDAASGHFDHNEDNPLKGSCVIVDEMSMVDIYLIRSLLRALRDGTRLILVGDQDQLPSVGAGNVLKDILQSGVLPFTRLTGVYRQEESSMIAINAHRINQGEMPILNRRNSDFFLDRQDGPARSADTVVRLCMERLPAFLRLDDGCRDIQVLSPQKKGPAGVLQLNKMLQQAYNPPAHGKPEISFGDIVFRPGDKVMHIHNDYQLHWVTADGDEGDGVFNGDLGFVREVDPDSDSLTVLFDDERLVTYSRAELEELDLAYCTSVHKSQGSEFPVVVMPVVRGPRLLMTRNLLYTALTRARRFVVLVGTEDVIRAMVDNDYVTTRYTGLCQRLVEMASPAAPSPEFD